MSILILSLFVSFIFLIAGIQSLRIYSIAHTAEYVLFSILFIFLALDTPFIFGIFSNSLIDDITFFVYMGLTYQLLHKVRDKVHIYQNVLFWTIFIISFILDVVVWSLSNSTSPIFINLSYLFDDIIIIYVGIDYFISYWHVNIVYVIKKTQIGRNIWIFVSLILIAIGTIRGSFYVLKIFEIITNTDFIKSLDSIISLSNLGLQISLVILALIAIITIFFLPEMFMITKPQIYSIMKLYSRVEKYQKDFQNKEISKLFLYDIIDYLKEVHNNFLLEETS